MACIIKLPVDNQKGILIFTTVEYSYVISGNQSLQHTISLLKDRWLIGLHHNEAHKDKKFLPNKIFDFHIAGQNDLESVDGSTFTQIDMDCSNFCPQFFKNNVKNCDKFWDVLIVARNTRFKSLDEMLLIIREVFNTKPVRVLAIVPHENLHLKNIGPSEVIDKYLKLFSDSERKMFTLMTPSLDYPFPFDLNTLAFYYRNSKTFFHAAREERHPRVAAYAWASGIPVIAHAQVGSLLPDKLQNPPGFWIYQDIKEASNHIHKAIMTQLNNKEKTLYSDMFLIDNNIQLFKEKIYNIYQKNNLPFSDTQWILNDLDIRLARHHAGDGIGNTLPLSVVKLVQILHDNRDNNIFPQISNNDFEKEFCILHKQNCHETPNYKSKNQPLATYKKQSENLTKWIKDKIKLLIRPRL